MTEQTLTELENKEEKNNKSAFLKVKERFSIRSKSKNKKSTDIPDTAENNKDSNGKNPEKATEDGKETVNEKIAEPEVIDDGKKEKKMKSSSTLERVKMRLSTRKKSSKKSESEAKTEEEIVISSKVETEHSDDEKKEGEEKTKEEKSKNLLQRILRFFRSKKNRDKVEKQDEDAEKSDPEHDEDKNDGNSDDDEDNEIIAICGKPDDEEKEAEKSVVIPIITTNKPPLPVGRRLPSSATTSHTRPMTQLDEALKQFKLSTAASRENLRNSRQDLSQMEEQVKVQLRSRPATPVISLRDHQPDNKLSSSLSDLRQ